MKRPKIWFLLLVGMAVVAAPVVYAAIHKNGQAPAAAQVPPAVRPADIVLPLDSYQPSPQERRIISTAVDILSKQCLKRFGHDFTIPDRSGTYGELPNARRYGLVDDVHAAVSGYHQDAAEVQRAKRIMSATKMSDEVAAVWGGDLTGGGVPAGGCLGEANRTLSGRTDPSQQRQLGQDLARDSFMRSKADPRVRSAVQRWSACMSERGYRYSSPFDASADPRWKIRPETMPSSAEIAVALADVACNRREHLAGTWISVEAELQRKLIAQHRTVLDQVRAVIERQVAASAKLVRKADSAMPAND